jgi:hypothetical protein
MVASFGQASGDKKQEEILKSHAIPMLAHFGTYILKPLKTYCQKPGEKKAIEVPLVDENNAMEEVLGKMKTILCESVNALDSTFMNFGEQIIKQMNIDKTGTNEGHSVSQL